MSSGPGAGPAGVHRFPGWRHVSAVTPMGERALLAETDGTASALALFEALLRDPLAHQSELVPGARSVLIRFSAPVPPAWVADLRRRLGMAAPPGETAHGTVTGVAASPENMGLGEITLCVVYDGPDLHEVAALTGSSPEAVVAAHTGGTWRVAFCGFSPGFGYLVGDAARPTVPRRDTPRPRVPAGSVGLAGEYSGVYPSATPGGWQLIGRTDAALWDVRRDPPALLRPGMSVRFRAVRDSAVTASAPPPDGRTVRPGVDAPGPDARPAREMGSPVLGTAADGGWQAGSGESGDDYPDAAGSPAGTAAAPAREPAATLTVLRPGMQCTVQDLGRPGWAAMGVGPSGAADRGAALRANRIVGNDADAAVLEILLGGAEFRVGRATVLAVTGAPVGVRVLDGDGDDSGGDGTDMPDAMDRPIPVFAGDRIRLARPARGLRSYLAVRGGIDTWPELGSRSSDLLGGIGPEPLRAGDVLPIGGTHWGTPHPVRTPSLPHLLELDLLPGPQLDWFEPGALDRIAGASWIVSPQSNRVAVRLDPPDRRGTDRAGARRATGGPPGPRRIVTAELPVQGLVRGAVQIPPSGELVIFLADHPVTGGYPVIATLTDAAADLAAQARPGATVRLRAHPSAL